MAFSVPAKDASHTILMRGNQRNYKFSMDVVSGASCTINGLALAVKAVNDGCGIEKGLMTAV